jgi:hypothetical protein
LAPFELKALILAGGLAGACAGSPAAAPGPPAPPGPATASTAPPPTSPPFVNAGGLFLPEQVPSQANTLAELGLAIDPALLADPLSRVLGAVVNFGGCSASFVSNEGLLVTNHHCSIGALQYNSTPEQNLLKDGFTAASHADERWIGPTGRVFVTRSLRDVTAGVRAALATANDDLERYRALEKFEKESVAACECCRPSTRCELKRFYGGLRFYLVERRELRDVRLVYAPPAGIGNYGGEVDNWRWPRHTGDFAFFRAYVGKGGAAAEFASDNVPYRSPHKLELATRPLREGDLAIVAGYPGRTSMLEVAREVENTVGWLYPRRLAMFDEYVAAVESITKADPEAAIKGVGWLRRFNNFRTKHKGELFGFQQGKLLERKRADEAALRAFIDATPERRDRFGSAFAGIDRAIDERIAKREPDIALETEILLPRLLWAAKEIVRTAEERKKPDALRDPDYQERRLSDLRDELAALDKRYHPKLDRALLTLALERVLRTAPAERSPALELIAGKDPTRESIARAVEKLYAGTKLADSKSRLALFDQSTPASLAKSPDAMIRLAVALRPLLREVEERGDRYAGALLLHAPLAMSALLEQKGDVPPDANGTLRISYGVVKRPVDGKGRPFTLLGEIVQKHTGKDPFDAPLALLEAAKAKRYGRAFVPELGDVPVDFLTDLQITNGNSGSATLDADGKLTGLAFDGTFESVASDWIYLPTTRSIHVDVRYVLWVLSEVSKASALLAELGVTTEGAAAR